MIIRTGDRQLIKELNIALVMNVIRQHHSIARVDIAQHTGLGRSTVTGIVNLLLREGLVTETGSAESAAGRKPVLLTFNPAARYAVGVKLAPRSATVALVNLNAEVVSMAEVPLNPIQGSEVILAALCQAVNAALLEHDIPRSKVLGVGVVMPGVIDTATGTVISSYFLGWENLPIRDLLEEALELPVYVDNDANGVALAETLYGAGHGVQDVLAVTIGVGIGAGLIIGGQIHRGSRFNAGELGHVNVIRDGPACTCGRLGCLEAVAADAAIVRRAREQVTDGRADLLRVLVRGHPDLITREAVVEAARAGDPDAVAVLAESGRWLGLALSNAINLTSPARVVVGGEAVVDAGELILGPIRQTMHELVFPRFPADLEVLPAALGRNAWVIGAAALVLAEAFEVPIHRANTNAMARKVGQGAD